MNIVVFDTETIGLDKPFCYNIGYVVLNEKFNILLKREYVVEQIWHNTALFSTAYYADKRPIYVNRMKARQVIMDKYGYICQQMIRDFKAYNVERAFAYNSAFDERVFNFNCDWFKCNNPFDNIPISDIRGYAHQFLVNDLYFKFCEAFEYFTETGNYSTTAETMYRFINNTDFEEEHTALSDSQIEADILQACIFHGADINGDYKAKKTIARTTERTLHIQTAEQIDYYFDYTSIRINKDKTEIKLK